MPAIVRLQTQGEPVLDQPRPDRRVQGAPWRRTWTAHEALGTRVGLWECEVGRWRIAFAPDAQEFFQILAGRVRLHDAQGGSQDFGPGEAALIPPGFEGEFEVLEPVRKHFVWVQGVASAST